MHNCHSITTWCVFILLSYYDTCSTCCRSICYDAILYCMGTIMGIIAMGTIGIILYQHFVTARTSYVIGYDAILYCIGTVDMRPIIRGPLIWGRSIYDHPGGHRYVIHLDGFKLLVAGQRCHNVDSLIRDTASHSNHWVVRRATVALNDPTTTGW